VRIVAKYPGETQLKCTVLFHVEWLVNTELEADDTPGMARRRSTISR
jgi:hypothetical protein